MKNLCRKGKVHPSPSLSSSASSAASSSSAAGWTHRDAYTVLRLLPAAIATLSASLPPEDQEVLAYLIARFPDVETKNGTGGSSEDALLRGFSAGRAGAEKRKAATQPLRSHRPCFECACFQCYTSFWSRWDASPSRQTIHEAIELFEDHMAAAEAASRHRGKSRKGSKPGKDERSNEKPLHVPPWTAGSNKQQQDNGLKIAAFAGEQETCDSGESADPAVFAPEDSKPAPRSKQIVPFAFDDEAAPLKTKPEQQQAKAAAACPLGGRTLMRRMFPDIMGFVADHLWTAWSSPVRTADT